MNTCQHCRFFDSGASAEPSEYGECVINPPLVFVLKNEIRRSVRPQTTPGTLACGFFQSQPVPAWGNFSFGSPMNPAIAKDTLVVESEGGES